MEKLTITEASKIIQVNRDKIRYGSKLLGIKLIKSGRVSYVPASSITLLQAMYKIVASGISPKKAAKEVLELYAPSEPLEQPQVTTKEISNDILTDRIATLEKAVLLLVEENKKQREQLNKRFDRIELKLEPPVPKKIKAWQPAKPKRPKYSPLKHLWYELVNPAKLRANHVA